MDVIALHWVFALALFLGINWIGAHSEGYGYLPLTVLARRDSAPAFNLFYRVLAPVVGIVVLSAVLYALDLDRFAEGIWLVAVYYVAFRLFFNVVRGRTRLLDWGAQLGISALTIGLSFAAYRAFIHDRSTLLPNLDTVANELWILVALFLYQLGNRISISDQGTKRRKRGYLRHRLEVFRQKYGDIVEKADPPVIRLLAYAVLIYETFNRPGLDRWIEHWVLFPLGFAKTLGPMQVTTRKRISDRESVELGVAELEVAFPKALKLAREEYQERIEALPDGFPKELLEKMPDGVEREALRRTLSHYNPDSPYIYEVLSIFDELKELRPDLVDSGASAA